MARPRIYDRIDKLARYTPACVELGLREMGCDMKIGPKEAVLRCCFHNDKGKPNLYVNLDDKPGVYHCFACNAAGSFEGFVMGYMSWPMFKAVMQCREWARRVVNEPPPETLPKLVTLSDEDRLAPYRYRHAYVYERGLTEATAQRFDIGYDRTANAITIPWFSSNGSLVAIKRRSILSKYYIFEAGSDLSATLFGLSHVRQHAYLWIVEGEFDAMFMDQCFRIAHFDNHHATALGGKYLHDEQITALCRREPVSIVLMLDNDSAGREAQALVKRRLLSRAVVVDAPYPSEDTHDPNGLSFEQVIQLAHLTAKGK
jgi:DNA primase